MSSARCKNLLAWYRACGRDLPWRRTSDPYAVWVSEIMLQQTQVKTVLRRYGPWLRCFPDVEALAAAPLDAALKAWEGLGYYRRARLMHAAAQVVAAKHGGTWPRKLDEMLMLPGIGRSTAGAIASICFGQAHAVLDGNVKRVLKRWYGATAVAEKQLWQWARQHVEQADDAGDWNQAMMELGATVCTAKAPNCAACPVSDHCASAFAVKAAEAKKKEKPVRDVHWRVHLHLDAERGMWLLRRPANGIWGGLWSPPISELTPPPSRPPCHIHRLSHRRLHLYGELAACAPCGPGRWVADVQTVALPTGIRRLLGKHGLA